MLIPKTIQPFFFMSSVFLMKIDKKTYTNIEMVKRLADAANGQSMDWPALLKILSSELCRLTSLHNQDKIHSLYIMLGAHLTNLFILKTFDLQDEIDTRIMGSLQLLYLEQPKSKKPRTSPSRNHLLLKDFYPQPNKKWSVEQSSQSVKQTMLSPLNHRRSNNPNNFLSPSTL